MSDKDDEFGLPEFQKLMHAKAGRHHVDLRKGRDLDAFEKEVLAFWTPERVAQAEPVVPPGLPPVRSAYVSETAEESADLFGTEKLRDPSPPQPTYMKITGDTLKTAPYKSTAKMCFLRSDGSRSACTASFITNDVALTAGHCVFAPHDRKGFAYNIILKVQYEDGACAETLVVDNYYVSREWVIGHDHHYDFAFLGTTKPTTNGWLEKDFSGTVSRRASLLGYPHDKTSPEHFDGKFLWRCDTQADLVGGYAKAYADFQHGSSGGPWIPTDGLKVFAATSNHRGSPSKPDLRYEKGALLNNQAQDLYYAAIGAPMMWSMSLPKSDSKDVATLADSGYVFYGSHGYVYATYAWFDNIVTTNNLKDMGHYDIRLASNTNYVFAGMNGHVHAIKKSQFDEIDWSGDLPGAGHDITSVCADEDYVFAMCNGYLFRYDMAGKNEKKNELDGFGTGDGTLMEFGDWVYVGLGKWIAALDKATMTIHHMTKLSDNTDYVAIGGAERNPYFYAAYYDSEEKRCMITSIQKSDLSVVNTARLDTTNESYYNPIVSVADEYAVVGWSNFVECVRSSDFMEFWKRTLPVEDENSQIDVKLTNGALAVGFSGHGFQLQPENGEILNENTLNDKGKNNVSVAINHGNSRWRTMHFGTHGYAWCQAMSEVTNPV